MQGQWGPMLEALGASGKHGSSGLVAKQKPSGAGDSGGRTGEAAGKPSASLTEPASSQQAAPEEGGVWASLAAAALQEASARAGTQEESRGGDSAPADAAAPATFSKTGATGETSAGIGLDLGSLSLKHPWEEQPFSADSMPYQEPLTFTSAGVPPPPQPPPQRTRRVVRVVRSAKPPAAKSPPAGHAPLEPSGSETPPALKDSLLAFTSCSATPELSPSTRRALRDASSRTRKKRAAATLMEGTSSFHAPPPPPSEYDRSAGSPTGAPKHPSQTCGPECSPKPQTAQPRPPAPLPAGGAQGAAGSLNRLPHPMDPYLHASCAPPMWPPPAGPMQHASPHRHHYPAPAGGISPPRAGYQPIKLMQNPTLPLSTRHRADGRDAYNSTAVVETPADDVRPVPQRPPLFLAAALGRTDVVQSLLAATDYSDPEHPFLDHR